MDLFSSDGIRTCDKKIKTENTAENHRSLTRKEGLPWAAADQPTLLPGGGKSFSPKFITLRSHPPSLPPSLPQPFPLIRN